MHSSSRGIAIATKAAMALEVQLEDIQHRFELIEEERKASYETDKLSIQQNKEIISQIKEENMACRNRITQMQIEKPQPPERQQEKAMSNVNIYHRKYNLVKANNAKKQSELYQLDIKLSTLSADSKKHKSEATPEMQQIRVLEHRLDKTMVKYNEAQSIRQTYETIVKKLMEERLGFDNQLFAIESTLKAKEHDYEDLLLMSHDACQANQMALAELHRFEQGVLEERKQRDKEVQEKKTLVEQRVQMNRRLEECEKKFKQQHDPDRAGDCQLKATSVTSNLTAERSCGHAHEDQQKLQNYEEALDAVKEATGASNVGEVIQKLLMQKETQKNLADLTKRNQATIDCLIQERQKLKSQVEELKFSSGGNVSRRDAIDDLDHHVEEATEKFDRNKGKFESMAKILIDMKAGIDHLCVKLLPIKLGGEAPMKVNDKTIVKALQQCELKLSKLCSLTQNLDDPNDIKKMLAEKKYEEKLLIKNQLDARVKLTHIEEETDDEDDDFFEQIDEDVWHRKQVKYNK